MAKIYQIWEGPRKWYYDLCMETVRYRNPSVEVLDFAAAREIIGDFPPELEGVYVVHQVDWIRKRFLAAVGGMYVDADFICWHSLESVAQLASWWDYVGYQEWHGTGWMDNFFAARKDSPILQDAAEIAFRHIRESPHSVPWLATNAWTINEALQKHCWKRVLQIPTHLVSPVSVMDVQWFLSDKGDNEHLDDFQCLGWITSYHGIGDWVESFGGARDFLRHSRSRLAELFRIALR